jgi:elongation factor P
VDLSIRTGIGYPERLFESTDLRWPKSCVKFRNKESFQVATTSDLKNGMCLDIKGSLWTVIEFQHVKPGKGPAFVRTKMRQVLTGKVVEKTLNAGVKIEIAILEKREMQFLYKEGEDFVFMDNKTYDQMNISAATVGDAANYMLENTEAIVAIHENNPLYIELPASVQLTVTYTEPGLQGDRSSGGTKPATVETGIQIQVPLFIKQDEKIMVDTRDGSYQGRAN